MEKNFYRIFLVVAIGYILFLRMCAGGKPCDPVTITKTRTDTVYLDVFKESGWIKPEPKTIIKYDTRMDTEYIETSTALFDSATMLRKYQTLYAAYREKKFYEETFTTQYGDITTLDTVYDNRLMAHRVLTSFHIPEVTTTNTLVIKPRNQVYAGFGAFGSGRDLIKGFELNLALKNKKDDMYEIGGLMLTDGNLYLKLGMKVKLSFRKK